MTPDGVIEVRGAREHNLHDVDVVMPRDAVVAVTGISGSGKSSLAFGTIFAESQRRYLESVAPTLAGSSSRPGSRGSRR